jgi:hypothetical protein
VNLSSSSVIMTLTNDDDRFMMTDDMIGSR